MAVALVLALLLHGAFLGLLVLASHFSSEPRKQPTKPPAAVALRPMTADQWQRNRGKDAPPAPKPPEPPKPPEQKKPKEPEKTPQGQVVAVAPGNNEEDPNAKYLAESANKVSKETRAREQTPDYRNPMPQRTAPQARAGTGVAEQAAIAGNGGRGVNPLPPSQGGAPPSFEVPNVKRREELALKTEPQKPGPGLELPNRSGSDEVEGNSDRLNLSPGAGSSAEQGSEGLAGSIGLADLMPSQATLDRIAGAAANDHLKDLEEGDGTYLSTREWKYASFFNRVKQSVGMNWNPGRELRQRDPSGGIYSGRDRHTLLSVTLDARGYLQEVKIAKSCGLDFLDMEAVESFRRAQPFPNPPPGLLDKDSTVRFQFGFYMEMGGGPRMRLFRSAD